MNVEENSEETNKWFVSIVYLKHSVELELVTECMYSLWKKCMKDWCANECEERLLDLETGSFINYFNLTALQKYDSEWLTLVKPVPTKHYDIWLSGEVDKVFQQFLFWWVFSKTRLSFSS